MKRSKIRQNVQENLHRRQLEKSQRAAVGVDVEEMYAKYAKLRQGTRTDIKENFPEGSFGQSRDYAGKDFNVSGRYVGEAKRIKRNDIDAFQRIKRGELTISKAIDVVRIRSDSSNVWNTPKNI